MRGCIAEGNLARISMVMEDRTATKSISNGPRTTPAFAMDRGKAMMPVEHTRTDRL